MASRHSLALGLDLPASMRAVMAAFAVAAAGAAHAQEPAPASAAEPANVILEADSLVRDPDQDLIIAEGRVEARYGARVLRANRLVYDLGKRTVRAQGQVEIREADGTTTFADEVEVDEALNSGVATQVGARLAGGASLAANAAIRRLDGSAELDRVIYTACQVCADPAEGRPTWTLRARSAVQNVEDQLIVYRDAVLSVGPVPVFYTPYFAHPDPSAGRRSGLLTPDISRSRRLGSSYTQPYYWAISDHQDLTIAPQINEKINPLLHLQYRKRFYSGTLTLDGSLTHEADFDGDGDRFGEEAFRGHIFGEGLFRIDDFWSWGFGLERASDDLYLRRYRIDGQSEKRGLFVGDLTRLLSQVNVTGQNAKTYAGLSMVAIQGLQAFDQTNELPVVLPFAEYERVFKEPLLGGQVRLQGSATNLVREETGRDVARASAGLVWSRDTLVGAGLIARPFLEARTDSYRVAESGHEPETFGRALGLAGLEARLPFVRTGKSSTVLIEPILVASVGTRSENDRRVPNEDSIAFELDESAILRANGAPNYDLWEGGGRVALAVRAQAQLDSGGRASVMVGRRWKAAEAPRYSAVTNIDDSESDYVGVIEADFGAPLRSNVRFRLDDETLQLARVDADVAANVGRLGATLRYFRVDEKLRPSGDPSEELATDLSLRLTKRWSIGAGLRRDLDSDINLSQEARVSYRDECSFLEFSYRREETFDRRLGPDEGFQVRIGLTTLGALNGS